MLTKEEEGKKHKEWAKNLPPGKTLRYTDGSRSEDGTVSSAWHRIQTTRTTPRLLFEGKCNIGNRAEIEGGEIHAIQEGMQNHRRTKVDLDMIYLCVDNQNTLKALSRGPSSSREHKRRCLKEIEILQQRGCEI